MKKTLSNTVRAAGALLASCPAWAAPLTVPASTAYSVPNPEGLRIREDRGIGNWQDPAQSAVWYGQFKSAGDITAKIKVSLAKNRTAKFKLTLAGKSAEATASGGDEPVDVDFGSFAIPAAGYQRLILENLNPPGQPAGNILALELDGPAREGAHFNVDPRRNAASVHLSYETARDAPVTAFYNEVTAVEDPIHTYYMACGFSRGYFGMQVNSPTERRIIFSVWDAGSGQEAKDRSTVSEENHTTLLTQGEMVHASVFGNEGTGGHSHLKYMWKTGEAQKFVVTAKPDGTFTDYTGYWFHPEEKQWKLIASFHAPHDGKYLRGLYSFSENFGGETGNLLRKARFGNQWVRTADNKWTALTTARFSHDGTGKAARLDRFMGVEDGQFFLSHGGFVDGFTESGTPFTRPSEGKAPELKLPALP
ncbi:MAG: hypothetical protein JWL81_1897 [Verrucomicrobiales bacterium]|nr:hypothetical protein [Verrucomicrobiales bacterium]